MNVLMMRPCIKRDIKNLEARLIANGQVFVQEKTWYKRYHKWKKKKKMALSEKKKYTKRDRRVMIRKKKRATWWRVNQNKMITWKAKLKKMF
jgi:hypothetical protein